MSSNQNISQTLRGLFTMAKNALSLSWPESELPLIRHQPLDDDSDTLYWSDRKYLEELKNEIFASVRDGAFLWEMPALVWSERLYSEVDWPHDEASALLDAWKISLREAA